MSVGRRDDDTPDFKQRVEEALAGGQPLPNFPQVSPLQSLAMAQAEVAKEFEAQGFTRRESLYMTSAMFNGNPGIAPEN